MSATGVQNFSRAGRVPRLPAIAVLLPAIVMAGTIALAGCAPGRAQAGRQAPVQPQGRDATAQPSPGATAQPQGSTATTQPSPGATASRPADRDADADCRAEDLDPRPWYTGDGAAGSVYSGVVVRSRATKQCRLPGIPTVLVTDASGTVSPFQAVAACCAVPGIVLVPGGYAGFAVQTGNNPDGPACASGTFAIAFHDGSRYPLAGFEVNGSCRNPAVHGWRTVSDPASAAPLVTRAPASQP